MTQTEKELLQLFNKEAYISKQRLVSEFKVKQKQLNALVTAGILCTYTSTVGLGKTVMYTRAK